MYRPTANGFASGVGGMELGLIQAGVDVQQSLDIDTRATDCMSKNSHYFGHKIVNDSMERITVKGQPQADIAVGTYPCKKYSTMANLLGTRTGDDLFLHFFRQIVIGQPEMYIVENVPGMKRFKVVMEAMTEIPGYHMNIFCPVRAEYWVPQRRDRLILIGTKKPFKIDEPKPCNLRPKIKDIVEKNPNYVMHDYMIKRLEGGYRDRPIIVDQYDDSALAPTCLAHYSKDMGTRMLKDKNARYGARPFTIREWARLQGFPDDFEFPDDRSAYELIGNAVPPPMGEWIGKQAVKYFN